MVIASSWDTDNIPFYRDSIRWNRDITAWRDGDWVLSWEIAAVLLSLWGFNHGNSSLRSQQLEVWTFSKQTGEKEMKGWVAQNQIMVAYSRGFLWSLGREDDKERNSHAAKVEVYQRTFRFSVLLGVLLFREAEIN